MKNGERNVNEQYGKKQYKKKYLVRKYEEREQEQEIKEYEDCANESGTDRLDGGATLGHTYPT